jgi:hypothetical protein
MCSLFDLLRDIVSDRNYRRTFLLLSREKLSWYRKLAFGGKSQQIKESHGQPTSALQRALLLAFSLFSAVTQTTLSLRIKACRISFPMKTKWRGITVYLPLKIR